MVTEPWTGPALTCSERGGMTCFQFPGLARFPEITHRVFSRKGGLSKAPFDGLNVAFSVGDHPDNVRENRRLVAKAGDCRYTVYARQVHGTEILMYTGPETLGNPNTVPRTGDALVTNVPGLALAIQVADCQAILLYDPVRRVVANVHAGWRGSIHDIAGKTVASMGHRFGCRAEDVVAAIAPSLGPCCAEFIHYRTEIPENLWKYKDKTNRFDFWRMSADQLTAAGLKPDNIHTGGLCTRCRTDIFYSYRGEARHTGRFAVVIGLRPDGESRVDTGK